GLKTIGLGSGRMVSNVWVEMKKQRTGEHWLDLRDVQRGMNMEVRRSLRHTVQQLMMESFL
ncbi:hypothetical protein XENOCAPTIV_006350, partial [Xenoophorus captivus]